MANLITKGADGAIFPSFQEIRASLREDWKAVFGEKIDLTPTAPDGHHLDLETKTIAGLVELAQWVASLLDRNQAEGVYLEYLAAFLGLTRQEGETDDSLRRRMDSANIQGYATFNGMLTYLREKVSPGLSMEENVEDQTVGELKPHSFAVYIPEDTGMTDDQIAQAIWDCKPAGIRSMGDNSGFARDSAGYLHSVKFFRTVGRPFYARLTITAYEEEYLPKDYAELIREAVSAWAQGEYKVGVDIITQRLVVPVYSNVPGILRVLVEVRTDPDADWSQTDRIRIGIGEYASLPADNITVEKQG